MKIDQREAAEILRPPKRGRPLKGSARRDAMVALRVPMELKARYWEACGLRGTSLADDLIAYMERTVRRHRRTDT